MRDRELDLEEHNRYAFAECGNDVRPPSKALQLAITNSRKHIEAAFKHTMSEEKLGKLKVKMKVAS
jgi:hypothetical protein